MKLPVVLALSAALVLLSSCSRFDTALRRAEPAPVNQSLPEADPATREASYSYWSEPSSDEPLRVRIDLSEQTAYFYRGDEKVGQSRVATGRAGHSTPTGRFEIMEKSTGKRSNLYGRIYDANGEVVVSDADTRKHSVPDGGRFLGAAMPYWMRLTGSGIGMHVGPIPNPGRPASHGCVRMPSHMAETLFGNAPVGTEVAIVP